MKKVLLPLVLALCLVLVACGNHNTTSQNSDDSNEQTGTNQPDISTEPDHTETPEEPPADQPADWAAEAWAWAKAMGLMDGTRPTANITRQEVAVVLKRLYEAAKAGK